MCVHVHVPRPWCASRAYTARLLGAERRADWEDWEKIPSGGIRNWWRGGGGDKSGGSRWDQVRGRTIKIRRERTRNRKSRRDGGLGCVCLPACHAVARGGKPRAERRAKRNQPGMRSSRHMGGVPPSVGRPSRSHFEPCSSRCQRRNRRFVGTRRAVPTKENRWRRNIEGSQTWPRRRSWAHERRRPPTALSFVTRADGTHPLPSLFSSGAP